ncbi:MAG: glucosamine-6-phosphate deaminase [Planctomycetota bacterium]
MEKYIFGSKGELGEASAEAGAEVILRGIEEKGQANIILATGASQFETLESLIGHEEIDWSKVVMFHLDEYIGIDESHPASFRKYLRERFVDKIGGLRGVHFINPEADNPEGECARLGGIIEGHVIDAAFVGIGENGHLAFNDPPADFETEEPFIVVELDERCRRQQVGEGWFGSIEEVPKRAISMSIRQIMKSRCIIVSVPEKRKAKAVKESIEGPVTNMCPASILQEHADCRVFLDEESSELLRLRK